MKKDIELDRLFKQQKDDAVVSGSVEQELRQLQFVQVVIERCLFLGFCLPTQMFIDPFAAAATEAPGNGVVQGTDRHVRGTPAEK